MARPLYVGFGGGYPIATLAAQFDLLRKRKPCDKFIGAPPSFEIDLRIVRIGPGGHPSGFGKARLQPHRLISGILRHGECQGFLEIHAIRKFHSNLRVGGRDGG